MRSLLSVGRFAVLAGLVVVGLLALFLPGNRNAADGPADPILAIRRPILEGLREAGVVPQPSFFFGDAWLPTARSYGTKEARETDRIETRPVYRGLFWLIGTRYRCIVHNDDRYVRLRFTVLGPDGTRTVEEGRPADPVTRELVVEAFVPRGWRVWRLDGIDRDGRPDWLRMESTVDGPTELDPGP
jgi:hypothetical protein